MVIKRINRERERERERGNKHCSMLKFFVLRLHRGISFYFSESKRLSFLQVFVFIISVTRELFFVGSYTQKLHTSATETSSFMVTKVMKFGNQLITGSASYSSGFHAVYL